MIRIPQLKLHIYEDKSLLKEKICKKTGLKANDIKSFNIVKESIDARNKEEIKFVYTVDVELGDALEKKMISRFQFKKITEEKKESVKVHWAYKRPVIVGLGPCGMFAALKLLEAGVKPIILERGKPVEERIADVESFWHTGQLDIDSNVQFGEGGAGTFSDGKLTTGIKDKRVETVFKSFVAFGASQEILYKQNPHIGTDVLRVVVKNIREKIYSSGGEIKFNTRLDKINVEKDIDGLDRVTSIVTNTGERIETDHLILAIGHSARDTIEMLYHSGIALEQKPFAVGVRIEHLRRAIDAAQFGEHFAHPKLGASSYKLIHHCKNGRSVYTFCMCPGGVVVGSSSEKGMVVTNGMSYHSRDAENSNSALLVSISTDDFPTDDPLAGIEFQRELEKKAFLVGGETYAAPAQKIGHFLKRKEIDFIEENQIHPTYKPSVVWCDLEDCLPEFIVEALREAIPELAKKLKGFDDDNGVMTGVETRSSSPVRIKRNENYESENLLGMYPGGEGAGYAGGIVSAAVDGLKIAGNILNNAVNER